MRTDYILYAIAVICFGIAVAAYTLPLTEATELSLYVLAVIGIVFVGLGYMARPKKVSLAPTAATTAEPASRAMSSEAASEVKAETKKDTPKKRARKKTTKRRRKKS